MNERGFGPAFFFVQDGEAIGPRQHPPPPALSPNHSLDLTRRPLQRRERFRHPHLQELVGMELIPEARVMDATVEVDELDASS